MISLTPVWKVCSNHEESQPIYVNYPTPHSFTSCSCHTHQYWCTQREARVSAVLCHYNWRWRSMRSSSLGFRSFLLTRTPFVPSVCHRLSHSLAKLIKGTDGQQWSPLKQTIEKKHGIGQRAAFFHGGYIPASRFLGIKKVFVIIWRS